MLLGRRFGERLEPVAAMRHAMFHSPLLHAGSHAVSDLQIERLAIIDTIQERAKGLGIKVLLHLLTIEDKFAKIFRWPAFGNRIFCCSFFESCLDGIKSQFAHILLFLYYFVLE